MPSRRWLCKFICFVFGDFCSNSVAKLPYSTSLFRSFVDFYWCYRVSTSDRVNRFYMEMNCLAVMWETEDNRFFLSYMVQVPRNKHPGSLPNRQCLSHDDILIVSRVPYFHFPRSLALLVPAILMRMTVNETDWYIWLLRLYYLPQTSKQK